MANPFDEDNKQYSISIKKNELEDSMLDSTRRALNMLAESEDVGVESAKELILQGEALERIDKKLGHIDTGLSATQKNISKLKSPFGAFGAKVFGSTKSIFGTSSKNKLTPSKSNDSNLSKYLNASAGNVDVNRSSAMAAASVPGGDNHGNAFRSLTGSDREKEVEQNLNDMSSYLSRLKGLATNMGEEIDRQNSVISNIKNSSEMVESRMTGQRAALQKLLKK
ncbi:hypothetical protein ACOME3_002655 [Neoechinorhynchus agilis]